MWKFRKFYPTAKIFRQIDLQYNSLVTVWKSIQKRDHPEIFPSNHISKIDEIRPSVMDAFLHLGGFYV